jgi:hypothetical protein
MRNMLLTIALAFAFLVSPCFAQSPGPHAAEFNAFYAKFQAAARANDKQKLADMVAFPVADWSVERKGDVQTIAIKDRADFLARYDTLVTASMRKHVATGKPQPLQDARYVVIWDDADAEFSFEFGYTAGTGYQVTSYSIGPR